MPKPRPVEKPSRMAALTSGMPGPLSSKMRRSHAAAARVLDDGARQLRRDGDEPRLVDKAEAEPGGEGAHLAPRDDDVVLALKGD